MDWQPLRNISFLSKLTDPELQALGGLFSLRNAAPGERIVTENSPVTSFSLVLHGTVHVRRMAKKREVLLARIGPGGFFGEMNLFKNGAATASIDTIGETRLATAKSARLREFMEANPAIGYKISSALIIELTNRLKLTNERFANACFFAQQAKPSA
jgi:CRP-like cAMP-binding protein